jgi:cytochrome P450
MDVPQEIANVIVDPKAYAEGQPVDDAFVWLRRHAPFAKVQPDGYDPIWVVTRHADILGLELRSDLFANGLRQPILTTQDVLRAREASGFTGARTLVQMDPPEHGEFRRLTQSWFMPKNLKNLESQIRQLAKQSVDHMASLGGRCDFARDVALLYPLRVIMQILGVPRSDEPLMLKLTQELFGARDPELSRGGQGAANPLAAQAHLQQTMADLTAYFTELAHERRRNPTDDLATAIANGMPGGKLISIPDAIGYFIISATAGHDTTSSTTSAAVWALAERPQLLEQLRAGPEALKGHVEESVRWATAVKHFMRTATTDVEFAGSQIRKGDWIMISYASGNRDEAVFEHPFEYDISRPPNRHVAFGYGSHVCLGQHLGRMEMRILWEELLPRLKSLELDGTPARTRANFVCGPKSVPVRYQFY